MTPYYEHAGITIYHGDAGIVVPSLQPELADLMLVDPPYGMAYRSGKRSDSEVLSGDLDGLGASLFARVMWRAAVPLKADGHLCVFCHWESWPVFHRAITGFADVKNALIWWKNRGGMGDLSMQYAHDYEIVLYAARGRRGLLGKRRGAVFNGFPPIPLAQRSHPNEKPATLLAALISRHAPIKGLVLDPFMGSGASLVAAKATGRRAIGIDIEERYCEIAARRLRQGVLDFGGAA